MSISARPRVLVVGGGFAGLESAFVLRAKLGAHADITIVSDDENFLFKPNTIYIPFGMGADKLRIPIARAAGRRDIRFVHGRFRDLDRDAQRVTVDDWVIPYDYLVLATGAGMRPEEVPGLAEHAETIWTPAAMEKLGVRLRDTAARAGRGDRQRVLFVVPPNNKCAGPLYEIVLMLETWLRREGVREHVDLEWATVEHSYIQAFGPKLHDVVGDEFGERGITGHTDWSIDSVTAGTARFANGENRDFDVLITFPPYVASVRYEGLPSDDRGFLTTEPGWRRVAGHDRIFAPGDAGDFPVKQAFLAFLQADAVGAAIAAEVQGREPIGPFDPVSMCVMEEFDRATFAQVPLRTTGDPLRPVEVRPDSDGAYKVGVSPIWRLGKKMLGIYLPLRFRNGLPFHHGAPWAAMELGLKAMSGAFARK
jgi:sulfide:quinone oxidoreductase